MLLLEAARWAPSCGNRQSWRFVISRGRLLDELKNHLSRGNNWGRNAPLIITIASKADLGCQIEERDYYTLDLGLAMENMLLQGVHLGLIMHPIAGFDEAGVKTLLGIPGEYRIHALLIVGYPGSFSDVDKRTLDKEAMPRERKSIETFVFWEQWNDVNNHE